MPLLTSSPASRGIGSPAAAPARIGVAITANPTRYGLT